MKYKTLSMFVSSAITALIVVRLWNNKSVTETEGMFLAAGMGAIIGVLHAFLGNEIPEKNK